MSENSFETYKARLLLVDDEARVLTMYEDYFSDEFIVDTASSGQAALNKISQNYYDLILLDIAMPHMTGLDVLKHIKKDFPSVDVIMFTMSSSVDDVVCAMQHGAIDYIEKHKPRELIRMTLYKALEKRSLNQQVSFYRNQEKTESSLYEKIVGKSQKIREVIQTIKKLKNQNASILITGENGTGKELVAHLLTKQEGFGKRLQYSVNCGAISPHLIESELFGHVKGAFTDARGDRAGLFEQASGHDVFLDEIGELPLDLQPKLLRVLQEKEIKRVGSNKTTKVNFRLICSTNRDLKKMVAESKFREDLYFRINVVNIHVPPLRERKEDISLLSRYLLNECGYHKKEVSLEVAEILTEYYWPGNIRQLKNVMINMAIHSGDAGLIEKNHVPTEILFDAKGFLKDKLTQGHLNLQSIIEDVEKKLVYEALQKTDWVVVKAAELLGSHRNSINNKLKSWSWSRPQS